MLPNIIRMRDAPDVADQPSAVLLDWEIAEIMRGEQTTWHLTGRLPDRPTVRTTTALVELNLATLRARTQSGRVYELRGDPSGSDDVRVACALWAASTGASGCNFVTAKILHAH